MPLRVNSLEDVPNWSPQAKKALVDQGIPDVRSGGTRSSGGSSEYPPLSFNELRREEARTLLEIYRRVNDLDDGSAPERPKQLIGEVLELIEARLAELGRP